jgi:hypothetical protein
MTESIIVLTVKLVSVSGAPLLLVVPKKRRPVMSGSSNDVMPHITFYSCWRC